MANASTQTGALASLTKPFAAAIVAVADQLKALFTAQPVPYWTDYLQDCHQKDCRAKQG